MESSVDTEQVEKAKQVGGIYFGFLFNVIFNRIVELLSMTSAGEEGSQNACDLRPPKPDDVATICYTSGTTGLPVGPHFIFFLLN
jgi:acyl-CoA synthetase (AMP-forming)/AMP-acid ligase II